MIKQSEERVLDVRRLLCPMPVIKANKEIALLEPGEVLKILATDRGSVANFSAWCEDTGHELIKWEQQEDDVLRFWIRKASQEG